MTLTTGLPDISISVASGPLAVRQVLNDLLGALHPMSLDVDATGTVELVMAEALNNIVEHAYAEGKESGPIHVNCKQSGDGLFLTIRDCGRAMPHGTLPAGIAADVDVGIDNLPEGGFGWFLIKDLAKDVAYKRLSNENRLTFHLPVGGRSQDT